MSKWVFLCLTVLFCVAIVAHTASASGTDKCYVPPSDIDKACVTKGWCIQAERFAFQVLPKEEMSVQYLQYLGSTPGSPNIEYVIKYLMANPASRMFSCWIRPLPTMHSVDFKWNVGLALKSGEVVWATKWIYLTGGVYSSHDPFGLRFAPNMQGVSDSGCSFVVFCVFPSQTDAGKDWRNGQVSGLVIE